MARVDRPRRVDRAPRGDERLPGHLAAEHALAPLLRAPAAEQVHLERLEIEELDQVVERVLLAVGHDGAGYGTACVHGARHAVSSVIAARYGAERMVNDPGSRSRSTDARRATHRGRSPQRRGDRHTRPPASGPRTGSPAQSR